MGKEVLGCGPIVLAKLGLRRTAQPLNGPSRHGLIVDKLKKRIKILGTIYINILVNNII